MLVTVDALFSHNDLIGSKLIVKSTAHLCPDIKEKTSHVALLINKRWVHESTGHSGVRVLSYDAWSSINTEAARIYLGTKEYQKIADLFRDIRGKKYDYFGVVFLGVCIALTFLGIKLPKKNLCESKNKYFCCEALAYLINKDYGMSAPVQILKDLRAQYER